jgi:hypothetical protein
VWWYRPASPAHGKPRRGLWVPWHPGLQRKTSSQKKKKKQWIISLMIQWLWSIIESACWNFVITVFSVRISETLTESLPWHWSLFSDFSAVAGIPRKVSQLLRDEITLPRTIIATGLNKVVSCVLFYLECEVKSPRFAFLKHPAWWNSTPSFFLFHCYGKRGH